MLRALIFVHRWLGVIGCLLFAMWFATGVVLMYVGFPDLTNEERLAALEPIDARAVSVDAARALQSAGLRDAPQRVRLNMVAGRPAYHFLEWGGSWTTVFADTGERLASASPGLASLAANRFAAGARTATSGPLEFDQWTVSTSLHPYRPLYRIDVDDDRGTELYVSARTGEVVRDTTRSERGWNWVGSVLHWIYPGALVMNRPLWHQVVVWVSVVCTISVVTGMVIGVIRLRWRGHYATGSKSPYRGWLKWHHWLGLAFAAVTLTWIVSGLMSMNPWQLFPALELDRAELERFRGGAHELERFRTPRTAIVAAGRGVRELEWIRIGAQRFFVASRAWNDSWIIPADVDDAEPRREIDRQTLASAAQRAIRAGNLARIELLEQFDAYYYAHHDQRRLPVLRIVFNDPRATWLHIDPATGEPFQRLARANRVQRWLYSGLHSLDFLPLITRRPLWDVTLIVLCGGGLALSVTSVVLGWRRLTRRAATAQNPIPAEPLRAR